MNRLIRRYGASARVGKLSAARLKALDAFSRRGGQWFGAYTDTSQAVALALHRMGLIRIGTAGILNARHPIGAITERGLAALNEVSAAQRSHADSSLEHLPYGWVELPLQTDKFPIDK